MVERWNPLRRTTYTRHCSKSQRLLVRLYERRHSIMHWHESLNRITPNNLTTPENTSRGSALSWKPMRRGILKFPVLLRYFKCTLCLIETGEVTRADFSSGEQRSPIFQIALIPFEPGNFKRFREVSVEPVHHGSSLMVMLSAMAWVRQQSKGMEDCEFGRNVSNPADMLSLSSVILNYLFHTVRE